MYFAVNPIAPDWLPSLAQEFSALQSSLDGQLIYLHALVDGVHDPALIKKHLRQNPAGVSLYGHTALEGFGTMAPHLLHVPTGAAEPLWWLGPLVAACSGKPMLSVIASTLGGPALRQHLRPYLVCITADTTTWPIRWADTRVQAALLATLTPAQREHMLSPIHRWWSIRRDGTMQHW